jgi:hypothetical protein
MRLRTVRPALLAAALALAGPAHGQAAAPSRERATVAAPETRPFEQVVKLSKAGLSQEFLVRKIEREKAVYRLSTDDIIACKAAGLPEPVIEAMMKTDAPAEGAAPPPAPPAAPAKATPSAADVPVAPPAPAAAPSAVIPVAPPAPPAVSAEPATPALVAPVPAPPPTVAAPPAAAAPATPSLASQADRSWEGIVRRTPGVVLFKNPWEQGSLSFREEQLSWRDAGDDSRNFALPAAAIREHFLVCPKEAPSDEACFEWGVKTADGEQRFRDVAWAQGSSPKPRELFAFFEALYPDLPKAKVQVAKKK